MIQISKFTNPESSTFEKGFFVRLTDFSLLGVIFTSLLNFFRFQANLKIYSGKPDISFKFNSDKNVILKRENLKTKESYVRQISNRIRINYYLKNGNIYLSKNKSLLSEFKSYIFKVTYLTKSHILKVS